MKIDDNIYQDLCEYWGGKASVSQVKRIEAWLEENPMHKDCFEQYYQLFCQVNYAVKYDKVDLSRAKGEVLSRLSKKKKRTFSRYLVWSGSVAACLLGVVILFLRLGQRDVSPDLIPLPIMGGQANVTLVLGNGRELVVNKDSSFALKFDGINLKQQSGKGLRYINEQVSLPEKIQEEIVYNTIIVPRGGEYMLTLTDGTKVWLNSETEFKFPVHFGNGVREVEIVGEGYFDVAKDETKPFVVRTGKLDLTVLGTSFNVYAYKGENNIAVTLVNGKVQVQADACQEILTPGWQAVWNKEKGSLTKQQVPVRLVTSWKSGMFEFVDMPLRELTGQLERWYDVHFFFVNESIADIIFTGAIKRTNSLKFMLDFIEMTSDVKYEIKGKTVCLYKD